MVSEEAFRVACKTAGATQVSEAAAKAAIEVLINKQVALARLQLQQCKPQDARG